MPFWRASWSVCVLCRGHEAETQSTPHLMFTFQTIDLLYLE